MTIVCGIPLDGSQADHSTLRVAIGLASHTHNRIVIATHVIAPGDHVNDDFIATVQRKLDASVSSAATAHDAGMVNISQRVLIGPVAESLAAFAEAEGANVLVAAAHQRVGQPGLGSVAAELLTMASMPMVLVRDPAPWLSAFAGTRPLRILLGVDDSAVCDIALAWVHALGSSTAVHVALGAVYYADDAASRYGLAVGNMIDRNSEVETLLARDMLRRFHAPTTVPGQPTITVSAHPKLGLGRIGDHLLEIANNEQTDVIVVGTSQKTGLGKLGSVSSAIVNGAQQSVACIPPTAMVPVRVAAPMRCVVVATDGSAFANRAVPYAYGICSKTPDAEVHLIHVIDPDDHVDQATLRAHLQLLVPTDATTISFVHILIGDKPADELATMAARLGADIICIASHGRSGLARALVGSVADQLLRQTRLPVMVLRPSS
ncbi:MAG: universal stress protein [Kofleriaceae bacterium]|nr:universal stress protein [Kofleriaceae bacterium]